MMVAVVVCFGGHHGYRSAGVELHGRPLTFTFSLRAGEHSFSSEAFEIGTVHALDGCKLYACVEFRYSYDRDESTITVCGTDYESRDAMHLVTVPQQTSGYCIHPAAYQAIPIGERATAGTWCDLVRLSPGLEEALRALARSANAALISILENVPGLNVEVLQRSPASPADFRVVYRSGIFLGLYEPGRLYGPQDKVVHVDSVYRSNKRLTNLAKFANVIGSTPDPKVSSRSWIRLWMLKTNNARPTRCTSSGFGRFVCNTFFVGGHTVTGTIAQRVRAGTNNKVMIIPICVRHNNNDHVFMEARWNGRMAIILNNYLQ